MYNEANEPIVPDELEYIKMLKARIDQLRTELKQAEALHTDACNQIRRLRQALEEARKPLAKHCKAGMPYHGVMQEAIDIIDKALIGGE